jgi:ISXO2-like transposase domain
MCSSKKGVSAHQLWRNLWGTDETGKQLGSYRTAWFMAHRIRWALNQEPIARVLSGIVEADETYENGLCITSNTVEGYFSLLKRGVNGIFHHVGKQHLHRYLSEFDFRYNGRKLTDTDRATLAIKATEGKRLTLKDPKSAIQGKM